MAKFTTARKKRGARRSYPKRRTKARGGGRKYARKTGFSGAELKFRELKFSGTLPKTPTDLTGAEVDPATVLCLNGVATGSDPNTRIGLKITTKKISIRGTISVPPSLSAAGGTNPPIEQPQVRMFVYCDKQANLEQSQTEQVFDPTIAGLPQNAFRLLANSSRFQVIKDQLFTIPRQGGVDTALYGYGPASKAFNWNFSLNQVTNFNGTGGDIGNVASKAYHIGAFANQAGIKLEYTSRHRYSDF